MINFNDALCALASSPGIIITVIGNDGIMKYISKNVTLCLGYNIEDLIKSKNLYSNTKCIQDNKTTIQDNTYFRIHKNGNTKILMENIAVNKMTNSDIISLERIILEDVPLPVNDKSNVDTNNNAANVETKAEDDTSQNITSNISSSPYTQHACQLPSDVIQDFVDNGVMALKIVTGSGNIQYANKAEMQVLGFTPEEYIGKNIYILK